LGRSGSGEQIYFLDKNVQIVETIKLVILFTTGSGKMPTVADKTRSLQHNLTNQGTFAMRPETGDKFGQREARYRQVQPNPGERYVQKTSHHQA
jgi:hypothetical protein